MSENDVVDVGWHEAMLRLAAGGSPEQEDHAFDALAPLLRGLVDALIRNVREVWPERPDREAAELTALRIAVADGSRAFLLDGDGPRFDPPTDEVTNARWIHEWIGKVGEFVTEPLAQVVKESNIAELGRLHDAAERLSERQGTALEIERSALRARMRERSLGVSITEQSRPQERNFAWAVLKTTARRQPLNRNLVHVRHLSLLWSKSSNVVQVRASIIHSKLHDVHTNTPPEEFTGVIDLRNVHRPPDRLTWQRRPR
jgi:hypothetical protein